MDTYGNSVVKVVKYLIQHKRVWITDYEITDIVPQFGERIINELISSKVVTSTKDGIYYDDDNFEALKNYLRMMGVNIN